MKKLDYIKPLITSRHICVMAMVTTSIKVIVDSDNELDEDEILSKEYDDFWE
ncbi:MAG: hypothetical protein IJK49_09675 [Prevotella sp.]|nr:hypothetical protein [Prevotella sp.]